MRVTSSFFFYRKLSLIFCFNYFSCNSCLSILISLNHMLWASRYISAQILIEELSSKRSFSKRTFNIIWCRPFELLVKSLLYRLSTRLVACSLYPKLPFLSIFSLTFSHFPMIRQKILRGKVEKHLMSHTESTESINWLTSAAETAKCRIFNLFLSLVFFFFFLSHNSRYQSHVIKI